LDLDGILQQTLGFIDEVFFGMVVIDPEVGDPVLLRPMAVVAQVKNGVVPRL
jgi:hypothetical protein